MKKDLKHAHCETIDEVLNFIRENTLVRGEHWYEKALEYMPWLRKRPSALKFACSELYYDETDDTNDVKKVATSIKKSIVGE